MIQLGRYTFADEQARAADYRTRVKPSRVITVKGDHCATSCASWLTYLRTRYLDSFQIAPGLHQFTKLP
jgi:hypothetical protein